jgi:hypothetical protein
MEVLRAKSAILATLLVQHRMDLVGLQTRNENENTRLVALLKNT